MKSTIYLIMEDMKQTRGVHMTNSIDGNRRRAMLEKHLQAEDKVEELIEKYESIKLKKYGKNYGRVEEDEIIDDLRTLLPTNNSK